MLERVFNRALTQALFQGKKHDPIRLVLSILGEENSVAAQYDPKWVPTKIKL